MRELLFMSLFCEKIAENMGYAENALDRTHYSKIERGLRSPNVDTLFKIVFALNMKPHELVEIIEENVEFKFEKPSE